MWQGTGKWATMAPISGATVEASVTGAGTVSPASSISSLRASPPMVVTLTYTAVKAGKDTLVIAATVDPTRFLGLEMGGTQVSRTIPITVEECAYRFSITSRWRVKGEANIAILAKVQLAGVVANDHGTYSGTARVMWNVSAGTVGTCGGVLTPESSATVTGAPGRPGTIVWDIAYDPAPTTISVDCHGAGGAMSITIQAAPATVSVNDEGDVVSIRHKMTQPAPQGGTAVVYVMPVAP